MKTHYALGMMILIATGILSATTFSQDIDSNPGDVTYLFYLHGRIIEDEGPTPTHPRYGLYDYPAIIAALGSRGAIVVSEVRPSGTGTEQYARKTVADIEKLIADGISPEQIVVAGFSKGGGITIQTSRLLGRPGVRYVLLAACADWISSYPDLRLTGRILSIYEMTDKIGTSCRELAGRGSNVVSFEELKISTGKEHGAFYLPRPVWVTPLMDWVHGEGA